MKSIFTFFMFNFILATSNADVLVCQSFEKVGGWKAVRLSVLSFLSFRRCRALVFLDAA